MLQLANTCHTSPNIIICRQAATEQNTEKKEIYTVSQKNVPPLQLAIIFTYTVRLQQLFGTNVAEKVGNQNALYFPTSPN